MSVKIFFSSILVFLLVSSCKKTVDYSPDYKDELVINGTISPNTGVNVNIGHTLNPYISFDPNVIADFIDNAVVVLFENEQSIDTLTYISHGDYVSSPSTLIDSARKYHLEATVDNYELTKTETLEIPLKVSLSKLEHTFVENEGKLHFEVNDTNDKDGLYFLDLQLSKNDTIIRLSSTLVGLNNDLGCYGEVLSTKNFYFIDETCFVPNEVYFDVEFNHLSIVTNIVLHENDTTVADKISVLFSNMDIEYLKLIESYDTGEFTKQGSIEPSFLTFTNIINGKGVVLPLNDTIVDFYL